MTLTIMSNKRLKKLYIVYIFSSKYLPVSICMKSGTYFLIAEIIWDFLELELLNIVLKSASTSSNDILISWEFINPKESKALIS